MLVPHAIPGHCPCGFWHTAREPGKGSGVQLFSKAQIERTKRKSTFFTRNGGEVVEVVEFSQIFKLNKVWE